MNNINIDELVKQSGCDPILVDMIYKFTGSDYQGTEKILASIPKDNFLIKGKFLAGLTFKYGSFLFFYNTKETKCDRITVIISAGDKGASRYNLDEPWLEFEKNLKSYENHASMEIDMQKRFVKILNEAYAIEFFSKSLVYNKPPDLAPIKNFFIEILTNILDDPDIAVKLKIEEVDIFQLNRGYDISSYKLEEKNKNTDNDNANENYPNNGQGKEPLIIIDVDIELQPIGGTKISEIEQGGKVLVRITDRTSIADYLCELLECVENGIRKPLFAVLKESYITDAGVKVIVEFGPGIYGRAIFSEDVAVRTTRIESEEDLMKSQSILHKLSLKNFWWMVGTLIIIILMLLYFVVNR